MTIIDNDKYSVQARLRRRRRRISGNRHIRINIYGRANRLMIVGSICLMIMLGGYFGVRGDGIGDIKAFAAEETVYKTVTVYNGDTLWGIASTYTEPSKDIRKQVKAICDLNDVSPGKIYPGQVLLVPVPAHLA